MLPVKSSAAALPSFWRVVAICLVLAGTLVQGVAAPTPPGRKPNILIVLADQWRAQAFGFAGDPNVRTPNFDRLAAESVRFTNAISGLPVCSPTRATLMTGQRPLTHGVFMNDVPLNPGAMTLAKVLQREGYQTGMIGKWHIDGRGRSAFIPRERRQGFDYWKVLECTHNYSNSFYYADDPARRTWSGYDAFAQTSDACEFIRQQSRTNQPFLLTLAWGPPHDPYFTAPPKYRAMYDPEKIQLRPNVPAGLAKEVRKILAGYYAHCTALDDCMGQILDTLRESGMARDTILLFSSEHGDMLGSHNQFKKQRPFDESIRVPMMIRWPAGLGGDGRSLAAPMNTEDIMPTLLGLAGVTVPPTVEGLDFSGHLRGGPPPGDGTTVFRCVAPFGEWERRVGGKEYRALRTERYTYVRDLSGPWLLFDNATDPYQTNNLAGIAAAASLQSTLDAQLRRKLVEQKDAFLHARDYIAKWGYTVNTNGTVPFAN